MRLVHGSRLIATDSRIGPCSVSAPNGLALGGAIAASVSLNDAGQAASGSNLNAWPQTTSARILQADWHFYEPSTLWTAAQRTVGRFTGHVIDNRYTNLIDAPWFTEYIFTRSIPSYLESMSVQANLTTAVARSMHYSFDGTKVALLVGTSDPVPTSSCMPNHKLFVFDLANPAPALLDEGPPCIHFGEQSVAWAPDGQVTALPGLEPLPL